MEFQDRVTMSISNWTEYINDDDIEFAFLFNDPLVFGLV